MIENDAQLAATLDYIAKWADTLEGMRRHEAEQNGGVFPTIAAGPLHEIRTNLDAARAFAHAESEMAALAATPEERCAVGAM
jgi:hypothetical protein